MVLFIIKIDHDHPRIALGINAYTIAGFLRVIPKTGKRQGRCLVGEPESSDNFMALLVPDLPINFGVEGVGKRD